MFFPRRFDIHTSLATSENANLVSLTNSNPVRKQTSSRCFFLCLCVFRSRHADIRLLLHMRGRHAGLLSGVRRVGAPGLRVQNNCDPPKKLISRIRQYNISTTSQTPWLWTQTCERWAISGIFWFGEDCRVDWHVMPQVGAELKPKLISVQSVFLRYFHPLLVGALKIIAC